MFRRRQRFVPRSEGLEARQLLSTAPLDAPEPPIAEPTLVAPGAVQAGATDPPSDPPRTALEAFRRRNQLSDEARQQIIEARMQRIDRLPNFIKFLDLRREVPEEPLRRIQDDLRPLVGRLRPPSEAIASGFVDVLRDAIGTPSLRPSTAEQLNNAFAAVLRSAEVPPSTIGSLRAAMNDLVRAEAITSKPVVLATNDYAIVLQTILGVGRPIGRADLFAT